MITVCMATYNGQKYLEEQINSILIQLGKQDEIVVVDDCSDDDTLSILQRLARTDIRLNIFQNSQNSGPLRSFERAVGSAHGDVIFLADQDDVWLEYKVAAMLDALTTSGRVVVVSDAQVIDQNGVLLESSFFKLRHSGPGALKNFYRNTYLGCCMAFRSELREAVLPFPAAVAQHDEWIGLVGELVGGVAFSPHVLLSYRRHGSNTSSLTRFPIQRIIGNRLSMMLALIRRSPAILRSRSTWRRI